MKNLFLFLAMLFYSMSISAQQSFSQIIFLGDSLSDNGNLYKILKVIPKSPPYYEGRFSNGPVWADYLGSTLQDRFNTDVQNFAVGGATALPNPSYPELPTYSLKQEINNYLKKNILAPESIFAIWIGANDYFNKIDQNADNLVQEVVQSIVANINILITQGAHNFLILDLPDLSKSPYAKNISLSMQTQLTNLSQLHHTKLSEALDTLRQSHPDIKFIYMDIYSLFNDILNNTNSYNEKYNLHLTNKTDACWPGGYRDKNSNSIYPATAKKTASENASFKEAARVGKAFENGEQPCANPEEYIFWDTIHPTTVIHKLLSQIIAEKLLS